MKFAMEYKMMEPNKTDSLPFLSPKMPHPIPPISMPDICQLITRVLSASMVMSVAPTPRMLGAFTIVNNSKS